MSWAFSLDFHLEHFGDSAQTFFSFYSINRELSNSKAVFLLLHYPAKGKEEELSVYFRVDFFFLFYFLVLNLRIVQRRVELDC